jgi:hypothetical protein
LAPDPALLKRRARALHLTSLAPRRSEPLELLREMEKNKGAAGGGHKEAPRGRRVTQPRDTTPKPRLQLPREF